MTITIPDEALEAAALEAYCRWVSLGVANGGDEDEYRTWADLDDVEREQWREDTRAACLAMLAAWPEMMHGYGNGVGRIMLTYTHKPASEDGR